jgi:hypothetical protein
VGVAGAQPRPRARHLGRISDRPRPREEALYDATTLARLREHHVTLAEAELADISISAYDAAQRSGEVYPSPRLIELARVVKDGVPTWRVTTYDTGSGVQSEVILESE